MRNGWGEWMDHYLVSILHYPLYKSNLKFLGFAKKNCPGQWRRKARNQVIHFLLAISHGLEGGRQQRTVDEDHSKSAAPPITYSQHSSHCCLHEWASSAPMWSSASNDTGEVPTLRNSLLSELWLVPSLPIFQDKLKSCLHNFLDLLWLCFSPIVVDVPHVFCLTFLIWSGMCKQSWVP